MSFDSARLSHAYITDESYAKTLATAVVCSARDTDRPCMKCAHCDKALRGIHPDIIIIDKDKIKDIDKETGKEKVKPIVSVDIVRWIKRDVYVVPNDSMQKAYIVKDADTMNTSAQNAFLQMLEEPPKHAVFILCTENPSALLQTVRSRCAMAMSRPGATTAVSSGFAGSDRSDSDRNGSDVNDSDTNSSELKEFTDTFVTALEGNNVKLMECMFHMDTLERPVFSDFLVLAREQVGLALKESYLNNNVSISKKYVDAESIFQKAREMLDLNVSVGHISGFICASLIDLD